MNNVKRPLIHLFNPKGEPVACLENLERRNRLLEKENERLKRILQMRNRLQPHVEIEQQQPTMH